MFTPLFIVPEKSKMTLCEVLRLLSELFPVISTDPGPSNPTKNNEVS